MNACRYVLFFFCLMILLLISCREKSSGIPEIDQQVFNTYWDQTKVEMSNYTLHQSLHDRTFDGNVELVFDIENMSKTKQVRLNDPVRDVSDAIKVLTLHSNKEFIIDQDKHTLMSSVYTPVDYTSHPRSIKLAAGIQEKYGQMYTQLNWKGNRYDVQYFSYFDMDADQPASIVTHWLEDEIWTKIRVAPNTLPIGNITMLPGALFFQLSHQLPKSFDATTTLAQAGNEYVYSIHYPEIKRTLEIKFEKAFPYRIRSWTESNGKDEVTTAHLSGEINVSPASDFDQ